MLGQVSSGKIGKRATQEINYNKTFSDMAKSVEDVNAFLDAVLCDEGIATKKAQTHLGMYSYLKMKMKMKMKMKGWVFVERSLNGCCDSLQ